MGIKAGNLNSLIAYKLKPFYPIEMGFSPVIIKSHAKH